MSGTTTKKPRQRELNFQKHIIDSYLLAGGHAAKWASEWTAGNPDLVCCLPGLGVHLIEVKHIPTWDACRDIKNPMTPLQKLESCRYNQSGGLCLLAVAHGSSTATNSFLTLCYPYDRLNWGTVIETVPYRNGTKFNMGALLQPGPLEIARKKYVEAHPL